MYAVLDKASGFYVLPKPISFELDGLLYSDKPNYYWEEFEDAADFCKYWNKELSSVDLVIKEKQN